MGHLDNVIRQGSLGTTGRLNDRSVTIAEVLRDAGLLHGDDRQMASRPAERHAALAARLRSRAEPPRRRHVLSQPELQGGDDPLASRAQEPLYLERRAPRRAMRRSSAQNWYATYLWTDFGLKFIDEARQAKKPFFLYLPHNAPHFPLMAPAD